MSAHTAGPWEVFSVYAQHEVRTPTGSLVAVVNSRSDARLMAAAPDLLATLIEAAQVLEGCRYSELPMAAKCRAAIAKATGAAS